MIFARGATPTTPRRLAAAATIPATCVPCPWPSDRFCAALRRGQVDAVDVVDVAVAVVVGAVAGHLLEVGPDVRREVGVVELGAGVDDRDDRAGALGETPRAREVEHAALGERPLLVLQRLGGGERARGLQRAVRSLIVSSASRRAVSVLVANTLRFWAWASRAVRRRCAPARGAASGRRGYSSSEPE